MIRAHRLFSRVALVAAVLSLPGLAVHVGAARAQASADAGATCLACHKEKTPGLYRQWEHSRHSGAGVGCLDCHAAAAGEPDAFTHEGATIATLVTPKDCGACHARETEEMERSHHAKAGQILDSSDNYLAGVIAGHPAVVAGCEICHGNKIRIDPASANRLDRLSWPNSGIGRINPDGSLGSCNACHARHDFSKAQAREPENCGKCHLGPDHPQKEIYEESKHGIAFRANREQMNLDSVSWVVGQDYYLAPTCTTCHFGATATMPVTHDAGERISWTLRPSISKRQEDWAQKRAAMQSVCSTCHGRNFTDGHYVQYEGVVNLYDEKFAKPAGAIMEILKKNGSLKNQATFGNEIEWTYYELWHHEGRRARMGAAMMGPDYTWWHGLYEVVKHFYFEFDPAARATGDSEAIAYLDNLERSDPMHKWFTENKDVTKAALSSGETAAIYRRLFPVPQSAPVQK
jgi:hydroxylamine dehydrogenase